MTILFPLLDSKMDPIFNHTGISTLYHAVYADDPHLLDKGLPFTPVQLFVSGPVIVAETGQRTQRKFELLNLIIILDARRCYQFLIDLGIIVEDQFGSDVRIGTGDPLEELYFKVWNQAISTSELAAILTALGRLTTIQLSILSPLWRSQDRFRNGHINRSTAPDEYTTQQTNLLDFVGIVNPAQLVALLPQIDPTYFSSQFGFVLALHLRRRQPDIIACRQLLYHLHDINKLTFDTVLRQLIMSQHDLYDQTDAVVVDGGILQAYVQDHLTDLYTKIPVFDPRIKTPTLTVLEVFRYGTALIPEARPEWLPELLSSLEVTTEILRNRSDIIRADAVINEIDVRVDMPSGHWMVHASGVIPVRPLLLSKLIDTELSIAQSLECLPFEILLNNHRFWYTFPHCCRSDRSGQRIILVNTGAPRPPTSTLDQKAAIEWFNSGTCGRYAFDLRYDLAHLDNSHISRLIKYLRNSRSSKHDV